MKIKRVALVTPPYHSGVVESAGTWLNVGFVYIAGALRAAGYEVDYYDAMALWHDWGEIRHRLEDFRPHVVATTSFTASAPAAIELLALAREVNPEVITVLGNVHATFLYQEIFESHHRTVDYIVIREGEETLPELLDCLQAGDDPKKVPGITFYRDGEVVAAPPRALIRDLDRLPAAWDLVEWPIYTYKAKNNATLAIVSSSRGCLQQCSFCSQQLLWERTWRMRSPENFVTELEMLRDNYGVGVAMLADEIPTLNRRRWQKILDLMITRDVGVKLLLETRVDDIIRDEDIMDKYNAAGVEHIYVGVEAGEQSTLNLFKKNARVEQSRRAISIINDADIVSETSFVLGMPDDTPESIARTVELAKHYNPDMGFFLAIAPWPYADLYPQLKEYVVEKDYSKYNLVTPVLKPKNMTLEELNRELMMASKKFFMDKFRNLGKLSAWKQEFMLSVFNILINDSYLAEHMKSMMSAGHKMPAEVADLLRRVKGTRLKYEPKSRPGRREAEMRTLAPIP